MNDLQNRLVVLDLFIARNKPLRDVQERELKKVRSMKGDHADAEELLSRTKKSLKVAKNERKTIIAKLLKAQDMIGKKVEVDAKRTNSRAVTKAR